MDKCIYLKGPAVWQGCPDSDGDGITNHEDACPSQPGELTDRGCPPPDKDADGTPDRADRCPNDRGLRQFQGCPDTDGDGLPDVDDKCPTEKGDPVYDGCKALTTATVPKTSTANPPADGFVFVKGGTYTMGCKDGRDGECTEYEKFAHQVVVDDFYISKYEVTKRDWQNIMGFDLNKDITGCPDCPVEAVSWQQIQDFLKKLNAKKPGKKYRLPTEAEWEFAARGGNFSKEYQFSGDNNLDAVAWHSGNSESKTHPVGQKKANELGLFDMTGNVWEWCEDDWHDDFKGAPTDGRAWITEKRGDRRVYRGGSWGHEVLGCRVLSRGSGTPKRGGYGLGFRLARQ